jgi:hypothetical protein
MPFAALRLTLDQGKQVVDIDTIHDGGSLVLAAAMMGPRLLQWG